MNTLKVGDTSKAHRYTSQIVSQMWVTSSVTNNYAKLSLTHPTGHFWVKKIRKNLDISYRHIYLGHPLKLKGFWAYFILDYFIIVTPNGRAWSQCVQALWSAPQCSQTQLWSPHCFRLSSGLLLGNVAILDVVSSWFWRHGVVSSWHVGPTRPTCRRHHVMSGSFFLCRMSCRYLIADMSWIA